MNGRATGITGLYVDGTVYDVEFRVGSAASIWPDISNATFWGNPAGSDQAIDAVVAELNALTPIPSELAEADGAVAPFSSFVTVPHAFSGITPSTPFNDLTTVQATFFNNLWQNVGSSTSGTGNSLFPWAEFSIAAKGPLPPAQVIPTPSALVLVLTGTLSLVGVRRLRRVH